MRLVPRSCRVLPSSATVLLPSLALVLRLAPEGPAALAITWDAPAACPEVEYVRGRITEHLHGVTVEATRVRAHVSAPAVAGAPWRLRIAIGDEGQRELQGESCAALADAAAVMVAISLNAAGGANALDVPEPPPQAPPVDAPVEPPEPSATEPSPVTPGPVTPSPVEPGRVEPPLSLDLIDDLTPPGSTAPASRPEPARRSQQSPARAVIGVTIGAHGVGLPAPGAGLGGRVGVRWGPLSAAISGAHWFRRERAVVGDVAAGYRLSSFGPELCGVLARGRAPVAFEPFACAELEAGVLWAEGVRASPSRVQRHPWVAVGGGLGVAWVPRAWVAVALRADVVAPLLGRQFVIGSASAGQVGAVDVRGALVLETRVPRIVRSR